MELDPVGLTPWIFLRVLALVVETRAEKLSSESVEGAEMGG